MGSNPTGPAILFLVHCAFSVAETDFSVFFMVVCAFLLWLRFFVFSGEVCFFLTWLLGLGASKNVITIRRRVLRMTNRRGVWYICLSEGRRSLTYRQF